MKYFKAIVFIILASISFTLTAQASADTASKKDDARAKVETVKGQTALVLKAGHNKTIDLKDITTVYSTEDLRQVVASGSFEAIEVGSDQTWRPCYVPNGMDYWLEFASDLLVIKVAYAPSFGVDKWEYDENQTALCKKLASTFSGLSVREESGVKLCKEHLGVEAEHVLDPTLLWDRKFYTPIAEKSSFKNGGCKCPIE